MSYEDQNFKELFDALKKQFYNEDEYISEIIDNSILILTNRRSNTNDNIDLHKVENFSKYVKYILKDIYEDYINRTKSKKTIIEDIEYIGSGFTFITFRVGDNVIKFGKSESAIINKRLDSIYQVPTYIRESYEVGNKIYFRVEVSPYVDTTNITYEDAYKAYSNIRSLGYIWNDPKEENLGRIIGVNGCKIGGKEYLPQYKYKKGDLVVIDLDDIAYVGEETSDIILEEISMMSYNRNVYRFETRYIQEKEKNSKKSKL